MMVSIKQTDVSRIIIDPKIFRMYNRSSEEEFELLEQDPDKQEGNDFIDIDPSMTSLIAYEKLIKQYEEKSENELFDDCKLLLLPRS